MKKINLLGVPFAYGQDHQGVNEAYHYLKKMNLIDVLSQAGDVLDLGLLELSKIHTSSLEGNIKNRELCSSENKKISNFIKNICLKNNFLLTIGGDHGMGLGSIHGILHHRPDTIVIWADAHGDINTPQFSSTANFHGMPLAYLLGLVKSEDFDWMKNKLIPKNLIYIGPRDLDPFEKKIIKDLSIQYYSSNEIRIHGMQTTVNHALNRIDPFRMKPIHLSFDVDVIDPEFMAATGTRVSKGLNANEIMDLGKSLGETGCLRSMDVVEFNPHLGEDCTIQSCAKLILDFLKITLTSSIHSYKTHEKIINHFLEA